MNYKDLNFRSEQISKHFHLIDEIMEDEERVASMSKAHDFLNAIKPHAYALEKFMREKYHIHLHEWESNLDLITHDNFGGQKYVPLEVSYGKMRFGINSLFQILEIDSSGTPIQYIDTTTAIKYLTEKQWITAIDGALRSVSIQIDALLAEFNSRYEAQGKELQAKQS